MKAKIIFFGAVLITLLVAATSISAEKINKTVDPDEAMPHYSPPSEPKLYNCCYGPIGYYGPGGNPGCGPQDFAGAGGCYQIPDDYVP